ncbi:MAG: hypothetical protein AAF078_10505 [Planctomycetota bacterium]
MHVAEVLRSICWVADMVGSAWARRRRLRMEKKSEAMTRMRPGMSSHW